MFSCFSFNINWVKVSLESEGLSFRRDGGNVQVKAHQEGLGGKR
jgi:hypothetical protein